ncbi:hypothetical protein PT974_00429 [Cladobotryum mycophilum]|uniref:Aminoglycoside phosphotransferase domain-containing protein n=1 Tax=Cladobotryum mycophilum TaxID=491253 RepID=A0ABR0T120_9HYPO
MAYEEYSVEKEIAEFFGKTSVTRSACDARAKELVGGDVSIVNVQGACSYTVYAGPDLEYVVQFRLKSLKLDLGTLTLARTIYGSLAPSASFKGQMGDESHDKEPLCVYVMARIKGVTHLDLILAATTPENSPERFAERERLMADIGILFAKAWKSPQPIDGEYREKLRKRPDGELRMLLGALPERFHVFIQRCLDEIDSIMSLPMVLTHQDFGTCNIMVDATTCNLVGVLDWAEAEICPFGLNLQILQSFTGKLHLRNGWSRYEDYNNLQNVFWGTFRDEVGGLTDDQMRIIRLARILGLLISDGFTSRMANEPEPVPIGNDERGRYNMLSLDGFLINPTTKFEDIK